MFGNNFRNNRQNKFESNPQLINVIKENDQPSLASMILNDLSYGEAKYVLDEFIKNGQEEREDNIINDRLTLLHIAAFYDSLECFCYLHEKKKMSLSLKSTKSFFPLHYACYSGSIEVAAYILSTNEGAEQVKSIKNNLLLCFTINGNSPEILEELFRRGAILERPKHKNDDPIEKSIATDSYRCCEVLMRHASGYSNDFTPAMTAAKMCNPQLVDYLVKSSNDLEFSELVQKSVFTLIFDVSTGEKFRDIIYKWLSKYDDLEIEPPIDLHMNGVCHWICRLADLDIAKLMVKTKPIYINRIGLNNHLGPYYLANQTNLSDEAIIDILSVLISNGFDINFQPENGYCEPVLKIFLRTLKIRYKVIEFLLSNDANPYLPWSEDRSCTILDAVKKRKTNDKLYELFARYIK